MENTSYPVEKDWVLLLQNGNTGLRLHHGKPPIQHTQDWTGPHELSLRNHLVLLAILSFTIASCSSARIVNETSKGGTVLYTYIEEGDVLTSGGRTDALRLLDEKCPAGYSVSREGQIAQIDKAVDKAWMGQISRDGQVNREKRWAIQFSCK